MKEKPIIAQDGETADDARRRVVREDATRHDDPRLDDADRIARLEAKIAALEAQVKAKPRTDTDRREDEQRDLASFLTDERAYRARKALERLDEHRRITSPNTDESSLSIRERFLKRMYQQGRLPLKGDDR